MTSKRKKVARKAARIPTPREARTATSLAVLPRTVANERGGWLLVERGTVTIAQQRRGSAAEAMAVLPRRQFERLIDWYNTGKWGRR